MSARDLVGRPLVPFFDAEDNVNEALRVDMATQAHGQLDVDARVWDRQLGYFVYPNEDTSTSQHAHVPAHSQPIAIKKTAAMSAPTTSTADAAGSFGKLLLTPDMLSRSAPSNHSSGMEQMQNHINHNHATAASANNSRAATPRSASPKRSSRQKTRSSTPNKSRSKQQSPPSAQTQGQPSDGGSSGGEERTTGSDGSEKGKGKKNNKNGEPGSAKKTRNKQQQQPQQAAKGKDELSGNGKWAWSAFQSSPDPKSLPLPPFVAGGGASPGAGALPPPLDPPKIEERLDPPPPVRLDRPPSVPPDAPPLASIEHSMTQDLRRMLNIGS